MITKKVILIGILSVSLMACNLLDKLTKFDLNFSQEITIPASTILNLPFDIPTPPIQSNSENTFKSQNTHKDLVEEIILKKLVLDLISPASEDFSILKSVEIFIKADGMEDTKVAWLDNIPKNVSSLTLEVSKLDLKKYIFADSFILSLKTVTNKTNTRDYKIEVKSTFGVNAKILGI